MKLSEMRQVLNERGIVLTKSLGQNFMHDANQIHRIVAAAELSPTDKVLEIGPGLGPLTEQLVACAGEVLAIEKDARLVEVLRGRWQPTGEPGNKLTLLHADALDYLKQDTRDWRGWKLVSNLPYSVASPIIVELALTGLGPSLIVATLQLEVARRLLAKRGSEDYGLLTLLVGLYYEVRSWFKIPAGCFFPEPDVDSACVVLGGREGEMLSQAEQQTFTELVRAGFSQRRKMLLKLLKRSFDLEALKQAFSNTKVPEDARAESLDLAQFAKLARVLHTHARRDI